MSSIREINRKRLRRTREIFDNHGTTDIDILSFARTEFPGNSVIRRKCNRIWPV